MYADTEAQIWHLIKKKLSFKSDQICAVVSAYKILDVFQLKLNAESNL
jgi:hypothetical protein